MSSQQYNSGDVFWAPDPYKSGNNPRPWLVLSTNSLPYSGEDYVCAALTQSDLPDNHRVNSGDWRHGEPKNTSYCSPWVLATVKHAAVANPQGALTSDFVERIASDSVQYLAGDTGLAVTVS